MFKDKKKKSQESLMYKLSIILFCMGLLACDESRNLRGVWVDGTTERDTLIFRLDDTLVFRSGFVEFYVYYKNMNIDTDTAGKEYSKMTS